MRRPNAISISIKIIFSLIGCYISLITSATILIFNRRDKVTTCKRVVKLTFDSYQFPSIRCSKCCYRHPLIYEFTVIIKKYSSA